MKESISMHFRRAGTLEVATNTGPLKSLLATGLLDETASLKHIKVEIPVCDPYYYTYYDYLAGDEDIRKVLSMNKFVIEDIHKYISAVSMLLARTDQEEIANDMVQVSQVLNWLTEVANYLVMQQHKMKRSINRPFNPQI